MEIVVIVFGYLVGSIPFALLLTRRRGIELRDVGSRNPGAANVLRSAGVRPAVAVMLLDAAKGTVAVTAARVITDDVAVVTSAGVAAIVGHIYPVWLRFRGGKGVATACGVFAMLAPLAIPPALGVFFLAAWLTKYISVGSVLASAALPPIAYAIGTPLPTVAAAAAAAALIVFRHRSNLARVWLGTERRIGVRA